ncbi:hypothetical protein GPAL_3331 [Glaciecola pallidula DSM 14239 = ACAM 615]|uniref:Transposase n=1 Tax=Brumicola pallidula DSM 14239 = ACAM 615 TaxID=1121922 RepID=K6YBR1_9ALTE|nr:hypothetical protein GPAL_3331 [Glaciecola pallidula DSM 14239 = ACAM 615]
MLIQYPQHNIAANKRINTFFARWENFTFVFRVTQKPPHKLALYAGY